MRILITVTALLALGGWAVAADPTVEIAATGTTNANNFVKLTFEVNNGTVSATNPVAELTIGGTVIMASNYTTAVQSGVVTITVNANQAVGKATVKVKANLNNGTTSTGTKEVDFKPKASGGGA